MSEYKFQIFIISIILIMPGCSQWHRSDQQESWLTDQPISGTNGWIKVSNQDVIVIEESMRQEAIKLLESRSILPLSESDRKHFSLNRAEPEDKCFLVRAVTIGYPTYGLEVYLSPNGEAVFVTHGVFTKADISYTRRPILLITHDAPNVVYVGVTAAK